MQPTVAAPPASTSMMVVAIAGRCGDPAVTVHAPTVGAGGGAGNVVVEVVTVAVVVGVRTVDGRSVPLVEELGWFERAGASAVAGAAREHEVLSSPTRHTVATTTGRV
jgi:hypothetical protein